MVWRSRSLRVACERLKMAAGGYRKQRWLLCACELVAPLAGKLARHGLSRLVGLLISRAEARDTALAPVAQWLWVGNDSSCWRSRIAGVTFVNKLRFDSLLRSVAIRDPVVLAGRRLAGAAARIVAHLLGKWRVSSGPVIFTSPIVRTSRLAASVAVHIFGAGIRLAWCFVASTNDVLRRLFSSPIRRRRPVPARACRIAGLAFVAGMCSLFTRRLAASI